MLKSTNTLPEIDFCEPSTIRAHKCPSLDTENQLQQLENQTFNSENWGALGCTTPKSTENSSKTAVIIGFDWLTLQVNLMSNINDIIEAQTIANKFSIDKKFNVGLNWKKIYKIVLHHHGKSEVFAELETENKYASVTTSSIRFQNKFLYAENFLELAEDCFIAFKMQFVGISRIDLYTDFQKMSNNCSQTPENFIKNVFNGIYLKQGRASFMPFVKHDLYNRNLDQYNQERIDVNYYSKGGERTQITGARWGKITSGFQIKMYNKSLEMKDQKFKPWIEQTWIASGFKTDLPVYRLEFTVNRKDFYTYDKVTSEKFDNLRDINQLTTEFLQQLTKTLFHRHYKFHKTEIKIKGKTIKLTDRKRRLPEFYPLDLEQSSWIKQKITLENTSGRTQKTEITNLVKNYLSVKDIPSPLPKELLNVLAFKLSESGLYDWFYNKFSELKLPDDFGVFNYLPNTQLSNQNIFKNCPTCLK